MTTTPSPAEQSDNEADLELEEEIREEHKNWLKNAPYLYDHVMATATTWPSLTVSWLPEKTELVRIISYYSCYKLA